MFSFMFLRNISENMFFKQSQDLQSTEFSCIPSFLYCSDAERVNRGRLPSKNVELRSPLVYQRSLQTRGLGTISFFLFVICPKHAFDLK